MSSPTEPLLPKYVSNLDIHYNPEHMTHTAQSGTEYRPGKNPEPLAVNVPKGSTAQAKEVKADDSTPGIRGTRWSSVLACFVGVVCIALRVWGDEITVGQWHDDCEDQHGSEYQDDCKQYSGVLRVSCAAAIVFIVQTVFSICSVKSYDSYYILKTLAFLGLSAILLFTPEPVVRCSCLIKACCQTICCS